MNKTNIQKIILHELIIRSIKILDIGFITIIYVFIAFFSSVIIDNKLGIFNPKKEDKKSLFRLFMEISLHIYIIGVAIYIIRNIVELIPYPLNGYDGYDHSKLKELGGGVIFIFVFLFYQNYLREKMKYFYTRMFNSK